MLSRRSLVFTALFALSACGRTEDAKVADPGYPGIGGPFTLVDQDGKPVTEAALKGHWSAIYFGFTYCPDVCPTTLQALAEGLKSLGPRGEKVQAILISVDPERDTPEVMKEYVNNPSFPKGLKGFTGTPEQIAAVAKAYKVFYQKAGEGPDYQVQHQSIVYLTNPDGLVVRPLTGELSPKEIAAQIGDAMSHAA